MYKKGKTILLIFAGAVIVLILVNIIMEAPYRSHIPALPDLQVLSPLLRDQISEA